MYIFFKDIPLIAFLQHIPGPQFLGGFALFSAALILMGRYLIRMDNAKGIPMPDPGRLTPIEIAALRGGPTEVSRITILNLIQKKVLGIEGKGALTKVIRLKDEFLTNPLEGILFNYVKTSVFPREIFRDKALMKSIHRELWPVYQTLSDARLIRGVADVFFNWLVIILIEMAVIIVGGVKLYLGITRERPSLFLVLLLAFTVYAVVYLLKPLPCRRTALGERYLKRLLTHFHWIREACENGELPENMDPAFPASLYGVEVLAAIDQFGYLETSFTPRPHVKEGRTAFKGGCGSGCGGGGGCSAGGCSGGGCGGGCGGCGD